MSKMETMKATPLEILKSARELISDEKRWTKETYARDKGGRPVTERHQVAACWCSIGAIYRVGDQLAARNRAFDELTRAVGGGNIGTFNDSHTHPEVLAAFDAAISKLEPVSER